MSDFFNPQPVDQFGGVQQQDPFADLLAFLQQQQFQPGALGLQGGDNFDPENSANLALFKELLGAQGNQFAAENEPTSDAQILGRLQQAVPSPDEFSVDVFNAADELIKPALADLLDSAGGDAISAFNIANSSEYRQALLEQIGRTEWDAIAARDDEFGEAMREARSGEEKDQVGLEFYQQGLENLLATGAPSLQRNVGQIDTLSERFGGRPFPGGELPQFEGPGFASGGDASGQGDPFGGASRSELRSALGQSGGFTAALQQRLAQNPGGIRVNNQGNASVSDFLRESRASRRGIDRQLPAARRSRRSTTSRSSSRRSSTPRRSRSQTQSRNRSRDRGPFGLPSFLNLF